jgi:phosphotransferase system  glucose/maltose/N-acetylglucosamine-specific IIC component
MKIETKQLLARWQALEAGDGLRRAALIARVLWFVGLGLAVFVALAVAYNLHPAFVAVAAAVMGWTIAERNALRTRIAQWPIFRNYVDWDRVKQDVGDTTPSK